MDILQYLIELLKTRKQIGVKGLGTFYKKKTPGRYDAETHSFLPPSYALEFTTDVLEDTNLVEYIQTKRGISEDSAKYFISQFVEEVQKSLQQSDYQLDGLGSFKLVDNRLSFQPSQDINTGFDFYALPAVTAEVQQPQAEVNQETLPQVTEEPEIEQVQVPEFEQEMSKLNLTDELAVTEEPKEEASTEEATAEEEEVVSEEISDLEQALNEVKDEQEEVQPTEEVTLPEEVEEEETIEEITAAPIVEEEIVETSSITENEPTDTEVFEEITEVNTENPTQAQETPAETEENDAWNFDDENVVLPEDINEAPEEEIAEVENIEPVKSTNDFERKDDADGIKLSATTHEWDFDTISNNDVVEENTIKDFDNEASEADSEQEKRKMPLYQKLTFGLIALIVVFAILYFVKPEIFESFKRDTTNPDEKLAVPIERSNLKTQQDSISFADSIMQNAEKAGLDVQPAKDTLKVTAKTTAVNTTTYEIISAAIAAKRPKEVEQYIARMKQNGFDAKIAKNMPGKIYTKISIASYNNIDSATKDLKKLRLKLRNKDLYIFEDKNN